MPISRRKFLETVVRGSAAATLAAGLAPAAPSLAEAAGKTPAAGEKVTPTICPFCGCSCGFLVTAVNGKVINIEGDPQHPINRGAVCSKGAAIA